MAASTSQLIAFAAEFPIPPHDTIVWTYSGGNISRIDYRLGGEAGVLVAHVDYSYGGTAPAGSPFKSEFFVP